MKHTVQVHAGTHNAELNQKASLATEASVFVYYGHLEQVLGRLTDLQIPLSTYEKKRAEKFVFEKDRQLYIASHSMLKYYLSKHLNLPPNHVQITFENNRKPHLTGGKMPDFNLSHSGDVFAFAISNSPFCKVGIDVEKPKTDFDFQSIIENYMHPDEIAYIKDSAIEPSHQKERFYEIWTRKEALLKMCGIGIVANLPDINTSNGKHQISMEAPDFIERPPKSAAIETLKIEHYPLSLAYSSHDSVSISVQKI